MVLNNKVLVVVVTVFMLSGLRSLEAKGGETANRSYESFPELVSEFQNLTEALD